MEIASSFIILLDMTVGEARLDLATYSLQEGFLGFKLVPPGLHFVFAFVRWYVSDLDSPTPDVEAFNRWKYLGRRFSIKS